MARRSGFTPPPPKPPLELKDTPDNAKARLQDRIGKGLELKQRQITSYEKFEALQRDYRKWNDFNIELLKRLFTSDEPADEYRRWLTAGIGLDAPSFAEEVMDLQGKIEDKIHRIDSIIERIELIPMSSAYSNVTQGGNLEARPRSKKVFVVHGPDEVAKTNLEIFLREIGLEPIVLHRQADQGLTLIEKFERHSDGGYAFILLTPDEVAYLASDDAKPDAERHKEFRARPNVIFEFGYFVSKLGRSGVCCLFTGDVTLPSDLSGIIYKEYHKNIKEVAYDITKELKAAGYSIAIA